MVSVLNKMSCEDGKNFSSSFTLPTHQPGHYRECVQEIDAHHLLGYALYLGDKNNRVRYPLETYTEDVTGYCFHNRRFVQRLREKAMALPSVRLEEGSVISLIEENGIVKGVVYKSRSIGRELEAYAALTVICDGRFLKLRHALCNPKIETLSQYVALILDDCTLPYANHGHVVIGNPSAIAFYQISSTEIRCAVNIPDPKPLGEMARFLKNVIAHQWSSKSRKCYTEEELDVVRFETLDYIQAIM